MNLYVVSDDMYDESLKYISLPNSDYLGYVKTANGTYEAYKYLPSELVANYGINYAKKTFQNFEQAAMWICSQKSKKSNNKPTSLF